MPFVTVNGVELHTEELGSGPPLVMLHGILVGNLATWYFTVAPALARRSRVILYDLRGHGLSQRVDRGYDLGTLSADLAALVDRLGTGPLSLIGHSYGGLVALRFALDHPALVRKLALVDAPYPPSDQGQLQSLVEQPLEQMIEALPAHLRSSLHEGRRKASRFLSTLEFLTTRATLLEDLRAESGLDRHRLVSYPGEVLCVYGESSGCRQGGEQLASLLPGGRLVLLPGGHYLPMDSPAPLTRCLTELVHG